ncbi:MAG: ABC-type metal ion transporter, periplasmic subunit [Parcubacteria group bacterium GW2011_GWE2_39_37]|uniref:ABC-type metal ion transporter, periplasmic subunit n=1 Tax=Candidatus Falkowbacteria bacterium GW2011_GWF2_39_8 TaxID=1618642 RepID=A0A0G0PYJ9_9BACT|nr:MAG: ABC-type metal ion transporter, periplasmic subunit [Parcubacteria group bacterium GW2011_GWE2_39_37]KKR33219.1 MAG: ABC-type metal ion transporter, periplasmic subunit [Candidatus Falkowbacteria bacterium GW2011_GWF2_39_8]
MNIKIILLFGALLIGFVLLIFSPAMPKKKDQLQVVASFYPLYYFSQYVGGARAEVINLTPAGVEPHEYELTTRDMASLENADLLVMNGGGMESWSDDVIKNFPGINLVVVGEKLAIKKENVNDPHYWLSPLLAQQMVDNILMSFKQADPKNSQYYQANSDKFKAALVELHNDYQKGLNVCSNKTIVTAHQAFGHLSETYGLNQISIFGISPESEPSTRQLMEITETVKKNNIGYIFLESLADPRFSEMVAKETGAKTLVLNPLEGLTEAESAAGKNYLTEMRGNLENLKIALQCKK